MSRRGELTPRHRAAIESLAKGLSKAQAAEATGIRPETISRYMRNPHFVSALRAAQDATLGQVTRRMNAGASEMLDVLVEIATDAAQSPHVRARAALGWLAQLWRAIELHDLAERVAALEELLEAKDEKPRRSH